MTAHCLCQVSWVKLTLCRFLDSTIKSKSLLFSRVGYCLRLPWTRYPLGWWPIFWSNLCRHPVSFPKDGNRCINGGHLVLELLDNEAWILHIIWVPNPTDLVCAIWPLWLHNGESNPVRLLILIQQFYGWFCNVILPLSNVYYYWSYFILFVSHIWSSTPKLITHKCQCYLIST